MPVPVQIDKIGAGGTACPADLQLRLKAVDDIVGAGVRGRRLNIFRQRHRFYGGAVIVAIGNQQGIGTRLIDAWVECGATGDDAGAAPGIGEVAADTGAGAVEGKTAVVTIQHTGRCNLYDRAGSILRDFDRGSGRAAVLPVRDDELVNTRFVNHRIQDIAGRYNIAIDKGCPLVGKIGALAGAAAVQCQGRQHAI